MMYIDCEPLHDIKIPQMSKLVVIDSSGGGRNLKESRVVVKDMFSIYSMVADCERGNENNPMKEIFMNLLIYCSDKIKEYRSLYTKPPEKQTDEDRARVHDSDRLLRDFYELLNKLLGFGVIAFFDSYESLNQLAILSIESIQINSINPQLTYILEQSKVITDKDILMGNSLTKKIFTTFKKIARFVQLSPTSNPKASNEQQDDEDVGNCTSPQT